MNNGAERTRGRVATKKNRKEKKNEERN